MEIRTHDHAWRPVFICLSTALGIVLTTVAVGADDTAEQREQRYLATPLVELPGGRLWARPGTSGGRRIGAVTARGGSEPDRGGSSGMVATRNRVSARARAVHGAADGAQKPGADAWVVADR